MEKELADWHKLHEFHLYAGNFQTKDLANYLKVSPRAIQRWLRGKKEPKPEQLAQIKRYLAMKETASKESS